MFTYKFKHEDHCLSIYSADDILDIPESELVDFLEEQGWIVH